MSSRLAWGLWGLSQAMLLGGAVFGFLAGIPPRQIVFVVLLPVFVIAFATVGALVAARQPRNPLGWIFLGVAGLWSLSALFSGFTEYEAARGLATTLVRFTDWFGSWIFVPAIFLPASLLFLLFPNGRLPSRRWRPALWISLVGILGATASAALAPGPIEEAVVLRSNPFAIGSAGLWEAVDLIAYTAGILGMIASVAALIARFRRSSGDERQQIKALLSAGILVALVFVAASIAFETVSASADSVAAVLIQASILFALLLLPVAAGVAILRYRLYDIDVVIRKTVFAAALVVFVTLIYIAVVVGIGRAIGAAGASPALSLAATAIVAVLFQPARERAQRLADRLVYGKRATPYEVLAEFGGKVSETFATDDVLERMATVLAEGTGAEEATVWLRVGTQMRAVATSPPGPSPTSLPDDAVEVVHRGERLGALSVRMPASDPMNPTKRKLVEDLASQAGLVLRNVRLIEELRESRRRIVAAQDERAKKLERDIHDGAQQQLVALSVKLRIADQIVDRDPERAHELLGQLRDEMNDALENLRDLARGIYPPLLADKGLPAALEAQARKAPVPVALDTGGVGRLPQEVEAAVYFSVLEALQNTSKYSEAGRATVTLRQANGNVTFEVSDDGRGFDLSTVERGSGLRGMTDRIEAIGGELVIDSSPGRGTRIRGTVAAHEAEPR